MTEALNLGDAVSRAVAGMLTPEYIEKEVETRVAKLVTESVDRALRSYSDTGKLIEKAVEDALRVDRLDLPSYGLTVSTILKAQIESRVADLVAGKLSQDMDELLSLAPKEITLSKIAEEMRKPYEGDGYGEVITVYVEETEYSSTWIYLDEDDHYEDHEAGRKADIRILLSGDGTISSATFRGRELKKDKDIGRAYGLEQKIRAYHACGTKITLDEDRVCISVGDY